MYDEQVIAELLRILKRIGVIDMYELDRLIDVLQVRLLLRCSDHNT